MGGPNTERHKEACVTRAKAEFRSLWLGGRGGSLQDEDKSQCPVIRNLPALQRGYKVISANKSYDGQGPN